MEIFYLLLQREVVFGNFDIFDPDPFLFFEASNCGYVNISAQYVGSAFEKCKVISISGDCSAKATKEWYFSHGSTLGEDGSIIGMTFPPMVRFITKYSHDASINNIVMSIPEFFFDHGNSRKAKLLQTIAY